MRWSLRFGNHRNRKRGNTLAAAHEADALAGRELDVHPGPVEAGRLRDARAHLLTERGELWLFAGERRVDVGRAVTGVAQLFADGAEQLDRVGVAPALVGVGEVLADVAEARRAEQRVDHRVRQDVGVAVPGEAGLRAFDLHAAEDQRTPWLEAVRIEADAGARRAHGSLTRSAPAAARDARTPPARSHPRRSA